MVKPATYVNNSGVVIKELVENLNIKLSDMLIIYDDTNLETGALRIRKSGSDGGHNGLKSVIYHLNSDKFARLRIGVGNSKLNQDLADYVLSEFSQDDIDVIESKYPLIKDLIEQFISSGSSGMLDHYSKITKINSPNIS